MYPRDTDLVYNVLEQVLFGHVDGYTLRAHVVSGGRAGSKLPGVVHPGLANNPYATRVKLDTRTPGGPIVLGTYTLRTHEKRAHWIRLLPQRGAVMHGRAGFAIHGRGVRGSDGCLVPTDFTVVTTLHRIVAMREAAGRAAPTLAVVAVGDFDGLERRLRTFAHTA